LSKNRFWRRCNLIVIDLINNCSYRYQLVNEDDLSKFLKCAPDKFKDEKTFERAIFEHNLISLSRIYENINFTTLQRFLKIDLDKVIVK
jgi:hypothetical protein